MSQTSKLVDRMPRKISIYFKKLPDIFCRRQIIVFLGRVLNL
jgi:hypothetical protein